MKTILSLCAVAIIPLALAFAADADTPKSNQHLTQRNQDLSKFMKAKLKHSQAVLEALALEDFDLLADQAEYLKKIGNDAQWRVSPNLKYIQFSEEFTRLADNIARAAREKDLNGATLSYVRLTINCVDCHKLCRDFRILDPKLREVRP